ncbi:hypothetical protein GCM10009639_64190 [Kitasatospora putterlickiae]|uniref:Uncharacterized protein n=1 Tax=Kitasatospora putterlickiae TaxID=221725 RepID=A0ABN1YI24_9ACTN
MLESNARNLWIDRGGHTFPVIDRQVTELGRRGRVGREGTSVLAVVNADGTTPGGASLLDEIVREGARRMLAAALEAEVNANMAELADQRDESSLARRPDGLQPRLGGVGSRIGRLPTPHKWLTTSTEHGEASLAQPRYPRGRIYPTLNNVQDSGPPPERPPAHELCPPHTLGMALHGYRGPAMGSS